MKSSPDASDRIGDLIPIAIRIVRRRFPGISDDLVKDAVSSAVEKYLKCLPPDPERSVGEIFAWLRSTAINEVLQELRRSSNYAGAEAAKEILDRLSGGPQPDIQASQRILWEWLVTTLGPQSAETIWLHEIEHCPPRDIAIIQNIKIAAVKARITRSRQILRNYWRWIS